MIEIPLALFLPMAILCLFVIVYYAVNLIELYLGEEYLDSKIVYLMDDRGREIGVLDIFEVSPGRYEAAINETWFSDGHD